MGWREESDFKVPCSTFFFINASLNKTKYYLKNDFCKFKVQECYVRAPIPEVIFPLPVLLRLNIVTRW